MVGRRSKNDLGEFPGRAPFDPRPRVDQPAHHRPSDRSTSRIPSPPQLIQRPTDNLQTTRIPEPERENLHIAPASNVLYKIQFLML